MPKLPIVKNYLKNVAKSVKYVAINEVRDAFPMPFSMAEANADLTHEARAMFRNKGNIKRVQNQFLQSDVFKAGNEIYRNSMSSIKTGKFYDKARSDKADNAFFKKMMGGEDFDFDLSEDINDVDTESQDDTQASLDSLGDDLDNLGLGIDSSLKTTASAISATVMDSAKYTSETVKNTAAISYMQSLRTMKVLEAGFSSVSAGMKNIIKFQNERLNTHIQNATKFFDTSTNLLTEQNAMMKEMLEMQRNLYNSTRNANINRRESHNAYNDIMGFGGAFDVKNYLKNVKSNMTNFAEFSPFQMLWDMKDLLVANPLEFVISGTLINLMGGDKVKRQLGKLQKTMSGLFGHFLNQMDKWSNEGGIKGFIGSILGINQSEKARVDTANFERGAMQFNGIAQKAITDVIPGYLARIESALTGQEERFYDMKTGRWTNVSGIRKQFNSRYHSSDNAGMDEITNVFKKVLSNTDLKNINGNSYSQEEVSKIVNVVLNGILKNNGSYKDFDNAKDFFKQFGYTTGNSKRDNNLEDFIRAIAINLNHSTRAGLVHDIRSAKGAKNNLANDISNDPYDLMRKLMDNGLGGWRYADRAVDDLSYGYTDAYEERMYSGGTGGRGRRNKRKAQKLSPGPSVTTKYVAPTSVKKNDFNVFATFDIDDINAFPEGRDLIKYITDLDHVSSISGMNKSVINFINKITEFGISSFPNNSFEELIYYVLNGGDESFKAIRKAATSFYALPIPVRVFLEELYYKIHPKDKITSSEMAAKEAAKDDYEENSGKTLGDYKGNGFLDKLKRAKGLDKFGVIKAYTQDLAKTPMHAMAGIIAKVDSLIYTAFFGDKRVKDANGKEITGFIQRIGYEIGTTFTKARDWLKEKLFGEGFGRKFREGATQFGQRMFSGIKSSLGSFYNEVVGSENAADDAISNQDASKINLPGKAKGMGYVPHTGLYMLSRGEAVVPSKDNPDNPFRGSASIARDMANEKAVGASMGINVVHGYGKGTGKRKLAKAKKLSSADTEIHATNVVVSADGEGSSEENKSIYSKAWESLKKQYPAALGEGTATALVGGLIGGPFGLLIGAGLGAANNILKSNEAASELLFGDTKKLSIYGRIGGGLTKLLPKSMLAKIEKTKKTATDIKNFGIGGGVLGLASAALGGPVGLLGGMMIGGAVGWLRNNAEYQNKMFGRTIFSKDKFNLSKWLKDHPKLKKMGIGGVVGGFIGGPFGILGGMAAGAAIDYASNSTKFQDFLFGPRKKDVNGRDTNERDFESGFLGKSLNKMIAPIKSFGDKFADYVREGFVEPMQRAIVPVGKVMQVGTKNVYKLVESAMSTVFSPKLKLPFWKNFGRWMETNKKSKLLTGMLGGGAAGYMTGGPLGAILGGVLGAGAHYTGVDKWLVKAGAWLGKAPGKLLDKGTNRLNKWLINSGNADHMTAKERINFMDTHGYSYTGAKGQAMQSNDRLMMDSSLAEIKVMKDYVDLIQMVKSGKKMTKEKVAAKVIKMIKDSPLDDPSQREIVDLIRGIQENSTDKAAISASVSSIIGIINESDIPDHKKQDLISKVQDVVPLVAQIGAVSEEAKKRISNIKGIKYTTKKGKTGYFNLDAYEGDLSKASSYLEKEAKAKIEAGDTKENDPEVMLLDESKIQNQLTRESNDLLRVIAQLTAGEKVDLNGVGKYSSFGLATNASTSGVESGTKVRSDLDAIGRMQTVIDFNRKFNTVFDATNDDVYKKHFSNKNNLEFVMNYSGHISPRMANYIRMLPSKITKEEFERLVYIDNHTSISEQSMDMVAAVLRLKDSEWKNRIKPLAKHGFPLTGNLQQIIDMDKEDYDHMLKEFTVAHKAIESTELGKTVTQEDWVKNHKDINRFNTGQHSRITLFNDQNSTTKTGLSGAAAGMFLDPTGVSAVAAAAMYALQKIMPSMDFFQTHNAGDHAQELAETIKGKARGGYISKSGLYMLSKGEAVRGFAGGTSTGKVIEMVDGHPKEFKYTSEGSLEETNSKMNKDANEAIAKKESKWDDVLGYFKIKYKTLKEETKTKGRNLLGKAKGFLKGGLMGALGDLFRALDPTGGLATDVLSSAGSWMWRGAGRLARGAGRFVSKAAKFLPGKLRVLGGVLGGLVGAGAEEAAIAKKVEAAENAVPESAEEPIQSFIAKKLAGISASIIGLAGTVAGAGSLGGGGLGGAANLAADVAMTTAGSKALSKGANAIKTSAKKVTSTATKAATETAEHTGFLGKVAGYVRSGLSKIFGLVAKLVPDNVAKVLPRLGEIIGKKIMSKSALPRLGKLITKIVGGSIPYFNVAVGAWIAGSAILDYNNGCDKAEEIAGRPSDGSEIGDGIKCMCGISNAISEFLCGFISPQTIFRMMNSIAGTEAKDYVDPTNPSQAIKDNQDNKGWGETILDKAKEIGSNMYDSAKKMVSGAYNWFKDGVTNFFGGNKDTSKPSTGGLYPGRSPYSHNTKPASRFGKNIPNRVPYGVGGGEGMDNKSVIWNYLKGLGLGSNAIAGIMGNMEAESSFDPTIVQGGGHAQEITVDGSTGYGLCQWTSVDRQQGLVDYAKSKRTSTSDIKTQLDYMLMEAERDNPGLIQRMNAAKSPHDAAILFHREFERSADDLGMESRRGRMAEAVANDLGGGNFFSGAWKGIQNALGFGNSGSSQGQQQSGDGGIFGMINDWFKQQMGQYDFLFGSDSSAGGSRGGGSGGNGGGGGSFGSPLGNAGNVEGGSALSYVLNGIKAQDPGAQITAPYAEANHFGHVHGGVDIGADAGTKIPSPVNGVVVDNNRVSGSGYGNYIQIKDDKGNFHLFPHMDVPSTLSEGTRVHVGDYVGTIGSTGNSTGPHLHYQIDPPSNEGASSGGKHIDPGSYPGPTPSANQMAIDLGANKDLDRAIGGPNPGDELKTDYTDQLNQVIQLLGAILAAIQATGGAGNPTLVAAGPGIDQAVTNKILSSTPTQSIAKILSSMIGLSKH